MTLLVPWPELPKPGPLRAVLPPYAGPLLVPARYKSLRGGRGSSKTHTFAQIAVLRMAGLLPAYPSGPVRFASARQFQINISESVKQVVEAYIYTYGLDDEFELQEYEINNARTGSHMWFPGFNRHPESLMGTEGMDVLWIEQAETIGGEMEKIIPTVRKPGSEAWFSWNPDGRLQWTWQRFVAHPRPLDVSMLVNWYDNPWFYETEMNAERLALLEEAPERYPHVWLGEPDDADAGRQVLPYQVLARCVEAYRQGLYPSVDDAPLTDAGLDLAEGGVDRCALVVRRGPCIELVDVWPGVTGDLSRAATRAHGHCTDWAVYSLFYDGAAPIRTEFLRLDGNYGVYPVSFGGKVGGPTLLYETTRPNEQVFARRNIQMADALRLRANRTVRLLQGADVDPAQCLFINPAIPRLEAFLAELSAPIRRVTPTTGKWELDKRGGDAAAKSPDMFDAACLAFARDSERGLRAW